MTDFWNNHLGPQCVLHLEKPGETSECIALTIGVNEGAISVEDGIAHLQKRGVDARTIDRMVKALAGTVGTHDRSFGSTTAPVVTRV